jgi:hypothetical protein
VIRAQLHFLQWLNLTDKSSDANRAAIDAKDKGYGFILVDTNPASGSVEASASGITVKGNYGIDVTNWGVDDLFYISNPYKSSPNDVSQTAFAQGNGTTGQPLFWSEPNNGTDTAGSVNIVLAEGLVATNCALSDVVNDIHSKTGMVISG